MAFVQWQLTLPVPLRAIFSRWGEPCDPAPRIVPGQGDGRQLYRSLAVQDGLVALSGTQLAQIEADARFNAAYGQFAELRREGRQVLPWVLAVLAAGPAPQHIVIPY